MFLGLDLGTSGLRGIIVDQSQNVVAEAQAHYDVSSPHPNWSEQDPADWVVALDQVVTALRATNPDAVASLKGLGISGHMHGAVLLDADYKVLRPCILWNDGRSSQQAARMDADPKFRAISGNIVFPGFTAPKLAWVAENEPDLFAKTAKVMLPKDYLVWHLTGICATEMSDAAGTSWLDVAARDWSAELISSSGMSQDQMPQLYEGSDVVGPVRAGLGLPETCQVVAGAADNAAAACGIGAVDEGQAFVSLGTSGVALSGKSQCEVSPDNAVHSFCHAVPGRWYQMGVMLAATDSMNWLAGLLGQPVADLSDALPDTPSGPSTVRFLPYLSGERTPHNISSPHGTFLGLSKSTSPTDMTQAVMEGVAFGLRDSFEALKDTGTQIDTMMAIGGGTASKFWVQTLANVIGVPMHIPAKGDFGAALGAARLAMIGAGGLDADSVLTQPDIARTIQPDADLMPAYDAAYSKFKRSFDAVKDLT